MPTERDLVRESSTTRFICDALERSGPRTQLQLAREAEVTIGCICKCLKLLREEGYVERLGRRDPNVKGSMSGLLPLLYARTVRPLPEIPTGDLPEPPTPNELRDIMNSIIARSRKHS
jgi:hypothetical protein